MPSSDCTLGLLWMSKCFQFSLVLQHESTRLSGTWKWKVKWTMPCKRKRFVQSLIRRLYKLGCLYPHFALISQLNIELGRDAAKKKFNRWSHLQGINWMSVCLMHLCKAHCCPLLLPVLLQDATSLFSLTTKSYLGLGQCTQGLMTAVILLINWDDLASPNAGFLQGRQGGRMGGVVVSKMI